MKFKVFKDTENEWRWHLLADNNKIVADSGESYINKVDCLAGLSLVRSVDEDTPVESEDDWRTDRFKSV